MYGPFSESEARFLSGCHRVTENSRGCQAVFPAIPDGCPEHIRRNILERRAQMLGQTFVEFRSEERRRLDDLASAVARRLEGMRVKIDRSPDSDLPTVGLF